MTFKAILRPKKSAQIICEWPQKNRPAAPPIYKECHCEKLCALFCFCRLTVLPAGCTPQIPSDGKTSQANKNVVTITSVRASDDFLKEGPVLYLVWINPATIRIGYCYETSPQAAANKDWSRRDLIGATTPAD